MPSPSVSQFSQGTGSQMVDITPSVNMINSVNDYTAALALNELVQNSIESLVIAGKAGGISIHLDTRERSLTVEDEGPGMPPEKLRDWMIIGGRGKKVEPHEVVVATQLSQGNKLKSASMTERISSEDVDPPYCTGLMGRYGVGAMNAALFLAGDSGSVTVVSKVVGSRTTRSLTLLPQNIRESQKWEAQWRDQKVEDGEGSFFRVIIKGIPLVKMAQFGSRNELQKALKATYKPYLAMVELGLSYDEPNYPFGGMNLADPSIRDVWTITEEEGDVPQSIHPLEVWFRFYRSDGSNGKELVRGVPFLLGQARLRFFYHPRKADGETLPLEALSSASSLGSAASSDAVFSRTWRVGVRWQGVILPEDSSSHGSFQDLPLLRAPTAREEVPADPPGLKSLMPDIFSRIRCFIDVDGGFAPEKDKKRLQMTHELKMVLASLGEKKSANSSTDNDFALAEKKRIYMEIHYPPDEANLAYVADKRNTSTNRSGDTAGTRTFIQYRGPEHVALRKALINFASMGHKEKDEIETFIPIIGMKDEFGIAVLDAVTKRSTLASLKAYDNRDYPSDMRGICAVASGWTVGGQSFRSSYPDRICLSDEDVKTKRGEKGQKGSRKEASRKEIGKEERSRAPRFVLRLTGGGSGRRGSGSGAAKKDHGRLYEIAFFAYMDGWIKNDTRAPEALERDHHGNDTRLTVVFLDEYEEDEEGDSHGRSRTFVNTSHGTWSISLGDKFRCIPAKALLDTQNVVYWDRKMLETHLNLQKKRVPSRVCAQLSRENIQEYGEETFCHWMQEHFVTEHKRAPRPTLSPLVGCEDLVRELHSPSSPCLQFKVLRADDCAGYFEDLLLNVEIKKLNDIDGEQDISAFTMLNIRPVETKVEGRQRGEKASYGVYSIENQDWMLPVLRVLDTTSNEYEWHVRANVHENGKVKSILEWTRKFRIGYPIGIGTSWSMCVHSEACPPSKGKYKNICPTLSISLQSGIHLGEEFKCGLFISQLGAQLDLPTATEGSLDVHTVNVNSTNERSRAELTSFIRENKIPVAFGRPALDFIASDISPSIVQLSKSIGIELGVYDSMTDDGEYNCRIGDLCIESATVSVEGKRPGLNSAGLELKLSDFRIVPTPGYSVHNCGPVIPITGKNVLIRATYCSFDNSSPSTSNLLCEVNANIFPGPVVGLICEFSAESLLNQVEDVGARHELRVTRVKDALEPLTTFTIATTGVDHWGNPNYLSAKQPGAIRASAARLRLLCEGCSLTETVGHVKMSKSSSGVTLVELESASGCAELTFTAGSVAGSWYVFLYLDGDDKAADAVKYIQSNPEMDLSDGAISDTSLSVFKGMIKGMYLNILAPPQVQGCTFGFSSGQSPCGCNEEGDRVLRAVDRIAARPGTVISDLYLQLLPGEGEDPVDMPGVARVQIVPCDAEKKAPLASPIILAREHNGPIPGLRVPERAGSYLLQCFAHGESLTSAPKRPRGANGKAIESDASHRFRDLPDVIAKTLARLEVMPGAPKLAKPSAGVGAPPQRRGYAALPRNAVKVRVGKQVRLEFTLEDEFGNFISGCEALAGLRLESSAVVIDDVRILSEDHSYCATFLLTADVSDGEAKTINLCFQDADASRDCNLCTWTLIPQIGEPERLHPYFVPNLSHNSRPCVAGCAALHVCEVGSSLPLLRIAVHDASGSLCEFYDGEVTLVGEVRSVANPEDVIESVTPPLRPRSVQVLRGIAEFSDVRLFGGRGTDDILEGGDVLVVLKAIVKNSLSTSIEETRVEVQMRARRLDHLKFRPMSIKSLDNCVPGESIAVNPLGGVEVGVLTLDGSPASFKSVANKTFPLVYHLYLLLSGESEGKYKVGEAIVVENLSKYQAAQNPSQGSESQSQNPTMDNAFDKSSRELTFLAMWPVEALSPADCESAELVLSRQWSSSMAEGGLSQSSQKETVIRGLGGCTFSLSSHLSAIENIGSARQRRTSPSDGGGLVNITGNIADLEPAVQSAEEYEVLREIHRHLKRAEFAVEKLKKNLGGMRVQIQRRSEDVKVTQQKIEAAEAKLNLPVNVDLAANGLPLKLGPGEPPIVRAMCHVHGRSGPAWRDHGVLGPGLSFLSADTAPLARALSSAMSQSLSTVYCWADDAVTYMKANWKAIVERHMTQQQGRGHWSTSGAGTLHVAPLDAAHLINSRYKDGWDESDPQRRLRIEIMDSLDQENSGFVGYAVNLVRIDPIFLEPRWTLFVNNVPRNQLGGGKRSRQALSTEPVTIRSGLLWSVLKRTMVFETAASAEAYKRKVNEACRTGHRTHGHPTLVSLDGGYISSMGVETIRDSGAESAHARTSLRVENREEVLQTPLLPALAERATFRQELQENIDEKARLEGTILRIENDIAHGEHELLVKEADVAELKGRLPDGWMPAKRTRQ